ncbi:G2/mitotic-specific cyclin-B3-like [Electrophorus electricus]|uniref:G2/mitotic-specific cyclin-B3 n=1 Tax=Electrophorus electricus TaxID=8005 RepID=A0A4W4H0R3_ELEEL|nr:G2/mitotic-specific cyclin-B3-like [Electrophorus electricus]
MPFKRGKHCTVSKPKGKVNGLDKQVKRTSSSPQGGPKKRSAFTDLTNTNKSQNGDPAKNGKQGKRAPTSKMVKTTVCLKGSKSVPHEKHCSEAEGPVEKALLADSSEAHPEEQSPVPQRLESDGQEQKIAEAFDIDKDQAGDYLMSPEYAKDIFDYLKHREEKFVLTDYMHTQPDLNEDMRGILVDWMVEVQENFELNHETLYLAVKLIDHYLSVTVAMRESLQLIGSTAMLIAAKFEEQCPPSLDDFLYICDDAYKRQEFIAMERNILQGLKFDINIPVPYRFLRRYARVARASMETLTLARYVCELSLLELELVAERASRLASACLLLALVTKGLGGWTGALQRHSGYALRDLASLVRKLYAMLASPSDEQLKAVENKYSHKVFFEVAKIPLVHIETLEEALSEEDIHQ